MIIDGRWGVVGAQDYNVYQSLMERLGRAPRDN
jgi:hypothetical protein